MCCRTDRECDVCQYAFWTGCLVAVVVVGYAAGLRIKEMEHNFTGQLELIQQHHATLAKTDLPGHHRQILQQQLDSLYRDRLSCWDTFSRVLQVIDGSGSESAQPPPIVCRAQEENQRGREK